MYVCNCDFMNFLEFLKVKCQRRPELKVNVDLN